MMFAWSDVGTARAAGWAGGKTRHGGCRLMPETNLLLLE